MKWIDYELVIKTHKMTINKFGGLHGIKDIELVHSCILTPLSTFGNEDLYPTIEDKIAQCCYLFCKNHCFNDGNKRIGVLVLLYLCRVNNISLNYSQKELIDLGLGVAEGKYNKEYIKEWITKYSK